MKSVLLICFLQLSSLQSLVCAENARDSSMEVEKNVAVVVATLGGRDLDGEPEDLSWLGRGVKKVKRVYTYQRSHPKKKYYIATKNGNECLTYFTYIKDNYKSLPDAVIFVHADAKRHCPLISKVLELPNEQIIDILNDDEREIPGYLPLSKVFLNQTKSNLDRFKYPLISFSNYVQKEKYKYNIFRMNNNEDMIEDYKSGPLPHDRPAEPILPEHEQRRYADDYSSNFCDVVENSYPFVTEYPEYITTYTSGSFILSKEKILEYPHHFYKQFSEHLFVGGRTCGYLEYIWTTMWGGNPFSTSPDVDRSCGPMYHTDISRQGFHFFASDDGSVESGKLPEGYHGNIIHR